MVSVTTGSLFYNTTRMFFNVYQYVAVKLSSRQSAGVTRSVSQTEFYGTFDGSRAGKGVFLTQ